MDTQTDTAAPEVVLSGENEPSPFEFPRDQVETYERTGGAEGNTHHQLCWETGDHPDHQRREVRQGSARPR